MLRVVYSKHCNNYKRRAKSSSEKFKEEFIMRKKLLALLMCATMVLGTGVTAFAATSTKDAEKLYKDNYDKFDAEYYPEDSVIKADAYNGVKGTVEYGYLDGATDTLGQYQAVVIYKAADTINGTEKNEYYPATAVAAKFDATESTTETVDAAAKRVVNPSTVAAGTYAVTVKDDNGNAKQVVAVTKAADGSMTVTKTEGFVTNTDKYVKAPSTTTALLKGSKNILKSTDENAYGTIYANISAGSALAADLDAVVSAIDNKVFTKDAVAVKVTAYLQGTVANVNLGLENSNIYNGNAKALYNIDKLQAGTYTFDSDLISRTGFKGAEAVNVFQPTIAKTKFDTEAGTLVKDFVKVATVTVDKTIAFDNDASYVDGIFVFDKGEAASNNDGVSDSDATTAAAASTTTSSPKTGDVAPIAALAVVMMGACGAMVVASKKRA